MLSFLPNALKGVNNGRKRTYRYETIKEVHKGAEGGSEKSNFYVGWE